MSSTTDRTESTEIAERNEADLIADVRGEIDAEDLLLPMLKIGQGLSAEVSNGDARAGQFINSLTGEAKDGPVELVVVSYRKGRFFSPENSSEAYLAFGAVAPDNWPAEYAGQHFADLPDAEEQFSARANSGEIDWGSGPPIRTTYNYIGFEATEPDLPVRISLQRTARKAAQKLNTLIAASPAPWAFVYEVTTVARDNAKGKFYVPQVRRGRKASDEERSRAVELARTLQAAEVKYHGDAEPERQAPSQDPDALSVA